MFPKTAHTMCVTAMFCFMVIVWVWSRWAAGCTIAPVCVSHVLPIHSSHRDKHWIFLKIYTWWSLKNTEGHLTALPEGIYRIFEESSNHLDKKYPLHCMTQVATLFPDPKKDTQNDIRPCSICTTWTNILKKWSVMFLYCYCILYCHTK